MNNDLVADSSFMERKYAEMRRKFGAADKPCGGGSADANPKLVAKRYMIA